MPDTPWTQRRFLGALVASVVAAGVKVPGLPAAEPLVEAIPASLAVPHYLVIHPRIGRDLMKIKWSPEEEPVDLEVEATTHPPRLEVVAELSRLEEIPLLEGDLLDAALAAMARGHVRPVPVATPLRLALARRCASPPQAAGLPPVAQASWPLLSWPMRPGRPGNGAGSRGW